MELGGVTLEEDDEGGVLVKLQEDPDTLADIESIWKKLEIPAPSLEFDDDIENEDLLDGDCGSPVNPFETGEDLVFVDPFENSLPDSDDADDDRLLLTKNVGRVGREFSLSQYDLNVRPQLNLPYRPIDSVRSYRDFAGSEGQVSSHTEEEEEEEEDEEEIIEEHDEHCQLVDCHGECLNDSFPQHHHFSSKDTKLKSRHASRHEDSDILSNSSGHLICDCDDCINQTEAVDCQCENCLASTDKSAPVVINGDASVSMVTCECEDCLRNPEESLSCQCEQCVPTSTTNNNSPDKLCKCADCIGHDNHLNSACNCAECQDLNGSKNSSSASSLKGQRVSPLGRSQEQESNEHVRPDLKAISSRSNWLSDKYRKSSDTGAKNRNIESSAIHRTIDLGAKNRNLEHVSINRHIVESGAKTRIANDMPLRKSSSDVFQGSKGHIQTQDSSKLSQSLPFRRDGGHVRNLRKSETTTVSARRSSSNRSFDQDGCCSNVTGKCDCTFCQSDQDNKALSRQNILLEDQLQKTEKDLKEKKQKYESELIDLKKENDKQQKLIQQSLSLGPDAKIEATMQHEITRLTSENLDLREVIDKQAEQIRKLKKMLKVYAKRLKEGEAAEIQAELEQEETNSVKNVAQIKHRERNYMGMLEYKKEDEGQMIKALVIELKPRVAAGLMPGLPAYLLFMCVRHTDYINDDEKVRSFLTSTINNIKKVVKKHHDDLDRVTMLLANTCRFLHTLKQYSGEKQFQAENTPRQNEHCLRNFDLGEYRQVFSDLAVWIYQTLIKLMEATIQPSIVAAVLDHEAIAGLTGSKPGGMRGRSSSVAQETPEHSLDSLMKSLNHFVRVLSQHAVDPELVKQIFRQLYYFLAASALNNLLLRKDMCNWSKGMQIRYNLSHLEQWLRDNKLQESGAGSTLDPIIQASQLLQARKTDADVDSVCDMCFNLTVPQIVKILNLYTPVDEFEERVPISFIRKIQQKLKMRPNPDNALLMDLKFSFSVTFPFNPSKIALETIEVPDILHVGKIATRL